MEKLRLNLSLIREKQKELGLLDADLARKMKVTPQWVSQLLQGAGRGNGVNANTILRLAKALRCKQKDLLT